MILQSLGAIITSGLEMLHVYVIKIDRSSSSYSSFELSKENFLSLIQSVGVTNYFSQDCF